MNLALRNITLQLVLTGFLASPAMGVNQIATLTPSVGVIHSGFGGSVAIDGTRAVVASVGNDNLISAYVYEVDSHGLWIESRLTPIDNGEADRGGSIDLDGDQIIIASDEKVTLFEKAPAGAWHQTTLLSHSFQSTSVSIDGGRAVIGTGDSQDDAIYLFEKNNSGAWVSTSITPSDEVVGFGRSVSIDGDRIIVGATNAAYIFELDSNGVWVESRLPATGVTGQAFYGYSVAIHGQRAIVGASHTWNANLGNVGAAHLYEQGNDGTWSESVFRSSDITYNHEFGSGVSIYGDTMLVGAEGDNSAYLFELNAVGVWVETKIQAADLQDRNFGRSVSLDADLAIVGTYGHYTDVPWGSAYLFQFGRSNIYCNGKRATVVLNYDQQPTANSDVIIGTAGNDIIDSLSGHDTVCAGDGDDIVRAGWGADWVDGGSGDDTIDGGGNSDYLNGGSGEDTINGQANADRIFGGDDDDILFGGTHSDRISGGRGEDLIYGESDDDVLYGNGGADEIHGGAGNDKLYGGQNNDKLYGNEGDDRIWGETGNDRIVGGDGNDDMLHGGDHNDTIFGGSGDDVIRGGNGRDMLYGQWGNDDVRAQAGDDYVTDGGSGFDNCQVSPGIDRLPINCE